MSLVKRFGAVDGIISVKNQSKGDFGFSGFLEVEFFSFNKFGMMCKKGLDLS